MEYLIIYLQVCIQLCTWLQYDSNMHMFYRDHPANVSFITKSTGCKRQYPFLRLPNHDAMKQTVPDGMNAIRDAIVNIFDIITGKDDTDSQRWGNALHNITRYVIYITILELK